MSYWIRRFDLPSARSQGFSEGWAVIVIDSKGMFSAWTDFGNYIYHWTSFGGDFPKFLLSLDDDYLARKVGSPTNVYDSEATLQAVKKGIKQAVSEKRLSKEDAAEERLRIKECDNLYYEANFGEWVRQSRISEAYEFGQVTLNPQLRGFLTNIWPRFKTALRESLPQAPPQTNFPRVRRVPRRPPLRLKAAPLLVRVRG